MPLSAAFLLIAQVGPNPALEPAPIVPDELAEQRRRSAERPQSAPVPRERSRLAQCMMTAAQNPNAGLDLARNWRETGLASEAAQAGQCLGFAMVRAGRYGEAVSALATAREEADAANPAYRARLGGMAGNAAMAGRDAEAAEPLFAQAVEDARRAANADLLTGLEVDHARSLVELGRSDEAVAALERARTGNPTNVRAWLLSATLSRRLDRLDEAQEQIEEAASLAPQDPAVGLEAGVIAALSGRAQDARRSFESVLIVAPDSDEANRARSYLEQLKPAEVSEQVEE